MDEAALARVEEQRLQLEANIATLRKSLRHWQTLEIDYEGLKEEYQGLPEGASSKQCIQAAKNFGPELVDDKELQTLLVDKNNGHKKPSQLVELLTKRSDYVLRNIETIRKQLSNAEKKRNALLLAENPDFQDDAGLPLKEITEELDEDGEIISSNVQAPGENASKLVDVLRKAGVTDINVDENGVTAEKLKSEVVSTSEANKDIANTQIPKISIQEEHAATNESGDDDSSVEDSTERGVKSLGPTNPTDTEEDAVLRQEMLQYGLGEVGAIVAELDLQEDTSDVPYDEYDNDEDVSEYDEDEDLDSVQSEDERGALKSSVMSNRYVKKMESLQKKLTAEGLQNVGPATNFPEDVAEQSNRPPAAEAARKAALARANSEETKSAMKQEPRLTKDDIKTKPAKKQVAFATNLDVASPELSKNTAKAEVEAEAEAQPKAEINPIAEAIVERTASTTNDKPIIATTVPSQPKKISKFKASRLSTRQTPMFPLPNLSFPPDNPLPPNPTSTPKDPPHHIISPNLIEKPIPPRPSPSAPDPSPFDFDEDLHRREVALEYQKVRNRKMHEQGGYVRGGEGENYGDETAPLPVEDEVTGKTRKVSRFKAARLKTGGL